MFNIAQWEKDGYWPKIFVSDEAETQRYRFAYDDLERRKGIKASYAGLINLHETEDFLMQLATHPRITEAVKFFLREDFRLNGTHIFCKHGNDTEKYVDWHQDVAYWNLEMTNAGLTVWYAIDDSTPQNGCLQVIPGTHLTNLQHHRTTDNENNLLTRHQQTEVTQEQMDRAIDLSLRSGEATIFHGLLIHGSRSNKSAHRRCGIAFRYI